MGKRAKSAHRRQRQRCVVAYLSGTGTPVRLTCASREVAAQRIRHYLHARPGVHIEPATPDDPANDQMRRGWRKERRALYGREF